MDSIIPSVDNTLTYGALELEGRRWARWLRDPADETCEVSRSTLTLQDLMNDGWDGKVRGPDGIWTAPTTVLDIPRDGLPDEIFEMAMALDLPGESIYRDISFMKVSTSKNNYSFVIGPGVICSCYASRTDGPHWSEIALALYRHFHAEELKYVFRIHVINQKTFDVVKNLHYKFGYEWPSPQVRHWEGGSPECNSLLATPNVRGVAALMLGEYPRGTSYISRVTTWTENSGLGRPVGLHMCIHIARTVLSR
ncbi:hypothetical protein N7532_011194 [Penicillium argentinense]|uniref:Uncharacterized protein n=1 Tax=Penicillium argentinense TaxID=1131581 RepID=A0A9W9EI56_9EURO|nr:uncharacterized protein N7532_011194 [Penicillium argentinense]KAJ5082151.1 hypothetical protein N7532_011194 [Penicillium argentinense]